MKERIYIRLFIISVLCLSVLGCSSGGSDSASGPALSTEERADEAPLIQDQDQGIVAGLNLDENISEEALISSNGEISWIDGLEGKALFLDSDGEFLSIPDSSDLDLPGNGALSVWVYPVEHVDFAGILHKGTETDFSDEAWSLQYWTSYKPAILLHNEAGVQKQITSDAALELDRWHHLAASWGFEEADGKSWFRFYVDGIKKGELDISSFLPVKNSAGDLIIGSQLPESHSTTYGHITFRGAIDNILIYSRPLTEEEITDLYNEYSGL